MHARGLRTGTGEPFDAVSVQWARFAWKLPSLKERLLAAGWLTGAQATTRFQVGRTTLARWRTLGRIKARICNENGEWLYWSSLEPVPDQVDLVRSTERGAVRVTLLPYRPPALPCGGKRVILASSNSPASSAAPARRSARHSARSRAARKRAWRGGASASLAPVPHALSPWQ